MKTHPAGLRATLRTPLTLLVLGATATFAHEGEHPPAPDPSHAEAVAAPADSGVVVSRPGDQETLFAFDDLAQFLLDAEDTEGTLTLAIATTEPGKGPPPHYRVDDDEVFVVLEGRAGIFNGGEMIEATPGTAVFVLKGTVYHFVNLSETEPLRMIVGLFPGKGFKTMFEEAAVEYAKPGGPDLAKVAAIAAAHGVELVPPPPLNRTNSRNAETCRVTRNCRKSVSRLFFWCLPSQPPLSQPYHESTRLLLPRNGLR